MKNNEVYFFALRELHYQVYQAAYDSKYHDKPADLEKVKHDEAHKITQSYSISKEEKQELYDQLVQMNVEPIKERLYEKSI